MAQRVEPYFDLCFVGLNLGSYARMSRDLGGIFRTILKRFGSKPGLDPKRLGPFRRCRASPEGALP